MSQLNLANVQPLASLGAVSAQPPSTPGGLPQFATSTGLQAVPTTPFPSAGQQLSLATPGVSTTTPLLGTLGGLQMTTPAATDGSAANAALQQSIQASLATLQTSIANLQALQTPQPSSFPASPAPTLTGGVANPLDLSSLTGGGAAGLGGLANSFGGLTGGGLGLDTGAMGLGSTFSSGLAGGLSSPGLLATPGALGGGFGGLGSGTFGAGLDTNALLSSPGLGAFGTAASFDASLLSTGLGTGLGGTGLGTGLGSGLGSSLTNPFASLGLSSGFGGFGTGSYPGLSPDSLYSPTPLQLGAPPAAGPAAAAAPEAAAAGRPAAAPLQESARAVVPEPPRDPAPLPPLLTKDGRIGIDAKANVSRLVGRTPTVFLNRITESCRGQVVCKLEYLSPFGGGDRAAWALVDGAERDHTLIPQRSILVCASSGNVGIGVAALGAQRGYKVVVTMPENMALEARCLLRAYGAEVVLTPATKGMKGAVSKAEQIVRATPHAVNLSQFSSADVLYIHRTTTGPELYCDTHGLLDVLVCGVGSGATLTGVAQFLKEQESKCKIVAVEPAECSLLSGGKPAPHRIQGLGVGFEPDVLDPELVDEIFTVRSEQAFEMARQLPRKEGLLVGPSSGAVVFAAVEIAKRPEMEGKLIACILPCGGERYLSSAVFEEVRRESLSMSVSPEAEFRFRREER